ncbi:hypothetical protein BDSB_17970 [Burkholderia dolosa PC543]|nr:hypothetical protein BDSB_17970 [Burkholderia dolosa PC543]
MRVRHAHARKSLSIANDECGLRQDVVKACTRRSSRVFVQLNAPAEYGAR